MQGCGRDTRHALGDKELEATLTGSPAVQAVFSGHDHKGGYACVAGVHFVVIEAMLESPEDSNAFCTVDVFEHEFTIRGHGSVASRTCALR